MNVSLITGQEAEGPVTGQLIGFRVGALPNDGGAVVDDESTDIDDGVVIFDNGEE